jgi:hypothetical protein
MCDYLFCLTSGLYFNENPIYMYSFCGGIVQPQSQFPCVCERFIYSQDQSTHIWLQQNRQTYPGNIKISHKYMSVSLRDRTLQFCFGNKGGCTVSFLGIQKWENQTFILDFHPALHLQCIPAVYDH